MFKLLKLGPLNFVATTYLVRYGSYRLVLGVSLGKRTARLETP